MGNEIEVLAQLKEGKDVWLVKDRRDGRLYVQKNVKKYDTDIYARLQRLGLPGMPRIISVREKDGVLTVIEEYINGRTVDEMLLEQGPFSAEDTIEIMMALCTLLNDLHSQDPPMIHRDIKPSNIMIGQNHEVWLLDFNAVKEFRSYSNRDTRLMGTPDFAAPEQYGFGQSDARTDIYGLGVTMNVMLTGELPSVQKPAGPLRSIIEKCTRLEPADRFKDAGELYRVLESVRGGDVSFQEHRNGPDQKAEKRLYDYAEAFRRTTDPEYENTRPKDVTESYLPVGFRSGRILHMITAVFGYLFIIWMSATVDWTDNGVSGGTGYQIYSGIMWFTTCVFTVFWFGNYRNIRRFFPGCRRTGLLGKCAIAAWGLTMAFLVVVLFAAVLVFVK